MTIGKRAIASSVRGAARGLSPEVALGLGVGIISQRAFRAGKEEGLVAIDSAHLYPVQVTRIAYRRGAYLRSYALEFIGLFAPRFTPADVKALEAGPGQRFEI